MKLGWVGARPPGHDSRQQDTQQQVTINQVQMTELVLDKPGVSCEPSLDEVSSDVGRNRLTSRAGGIMKSTYDRTGRRVGALLSVVAVVAAQLTVSLAAPAAPAATAAGPGTESDLARRQLATTCPRQIPCKMRLPSRMQLA